MAGERTLPGLGLTAFWNLGSDDWKPGMDENMRKLSALTNLKVLNAVASLPGSPTNGDIYLVTSGADTNKIAVRDNGAWVYLTPAAGWRLFDATAGVFKYFNGSSWTPEIPTSGTGGLTLLSVATAAGSSSLDFINLNGYDNFLFVIKQLRISAAAELWMRTSINNGSSYESGSTAYVYGVNRTLDTTQTITQTSAGDSKIPIGYLNQSYGNGWNGVVEYIGRDATQVSMFLSRGAAMTATKVEKQEVVGRRNAGSAIIDSLRFFPSTGTLTSGSIYCYGMRSSL